MALGEFDLIARYFARATPQAVLGPGDDCALVQPAAGMDLALTTDLLVEGTHFLPGTDPHDLGWKTLAVNLSDLAAMGARPRWALLALCLPAAEEAWLAAFAGGFHACAREFGVDLIGGDTTRGPLNLCVTAIGEVPAGQALRRSGAKAGDDIWISGQPGLAALGLTHLQGGLELPPRWQARCIERLQAPGPGSGWARPCAPGPRRHRHLRRPARRPGPHRPGLEAASSGHPRSAAPPARRRGPGCRHGCPALRR